jgi:hypothetical protein
VNSVGWVNVKTGMTQNVFVVISTRTQKSSSEKKRTYLAFVEFRLTSRLADFWTRNFVFRVTFPRGARCYQVAVRPPSIIHVAIGLGCIHNPLPELFPSVRLAGLPMILSGRCPTFGGLAASSDLDFDETGLESDGGGKLSRCQRKYFVPINLSKYPTSRLIK